MLRTVFRGILGLQIGAFATLLSPVPSYAQGFGGMAGMRKPKEAVLKRMLPAAVNLNQKRIKVAALNAAAGVPQDLVGILKTKWVTAIQKDPRFILDERNPETQLQFSITNYYVEARTIVASNAAPACTYYTGKIESSYQAVEVATGGPLDSENLSYVITDNGTKKTSTGNSITNVFRRGGATCNTGGKATQNEARDALVDGIVAEMSQRAAPLEESLTVLVPGGKLEPLSALAVSGRWAKLLEDAEKFEPLPKPDDDAYRLYLIGLAYEALAYQDAKDAADLEKGRRGDVSSDKARQALAQEEKDFNEAQGYLEKATKAYKDAMQAKPGEKEFRSPDGRMELAVQLYATISRHKSEYAEWVQKKRGEHVGAASANASRSADTGGGGSAAASSFEQIIGMCQDHLSDIAQMIKDHSAELPFTKPLTIAEDLKLRKECGAESKSIGEAIRAQLTAKPQK